MAITAGSLGPTLTIAGVWLFFDVITNGTGLMARYRWLIPQANRWAIVACVRALERRRLAIAAGAPTGID